MEVTVPGPPTLIVGTVAGPHVVGMRILHVPTNNRRAIQVAPPIVSGDRIMIATREDGRLVASKIISAVPGRCPNARRRRSLSAQATVCTLPIPDVTKMVGPSVVSITGAQLVPLSNQNVTFNAAGRVPVGVIAKPIKVSGTQECHGVEESVIQVNANQLGPRVPLMTIAATIFVVLAFLVETVIDTVLGNNPTSGNVAGTAPVTMTVPTIMEIGIAVRHGVVFVKTGIVDHIFRIVTTITTATIMIKLFVARLFLAPTVDTVLESKK